MLKPNTGLIDKYKAVFIPKGIEKTTFEDYAALLRKEGST